MFNFYLYHWLLKATYKHGVSSGGMTTGFGPFELPPRSHYVKSLQSFLFFGCNSQGPLSPKIVSTYLNLFDSASIKLTAWPQWHYLCLTSGFSVGSCINEEEGYLLPTRARKITCRCFDWTLQFFRKVIVILPIMMTDDGFGPFELPPWSHYVKSLQSFLFLGRYSQVPLSPKIVSTY